VAELASRQSVGLTVVSKFCLSNPAIITRLYEAAPNGVFSIADSNMANFASLPATLRCVKSVIKTRLSDIRALPDLPAYARPQRLFVSDEVLLEAIAALPAGMRPEAVFIAEAGDLRDGFYPAEIPAIAARYPEVSFGGVSVNFGCLSGKMPDAGSVRALRECAEAVVRARGAGEEAALSVGGTVVYPLLAAGALAGLVTEIRMGEGIFFGYDSSSGAALEGFRRNAFTLYGEIVEVREKFIAPVENAGHTAFGGEAAPRVRGKRRCAVLDFGLLGASMRDITPLDAALTLAGQTFDFTVVDITESAESYRTGGYIPFTAQYAASSQAMLQARPARPPRPAVPGRR
jgi:predicted amino acid racemase